MPNRYWIRDGYRARRRPRYDDDPEDGVTWQPDLYAQAAAVAQRLGASKVVDVGCGRGAKLAALYPAVDIIGIDYGPNIAHCRQQYPFGTWIEHDLEGAEPFPLDVTQLAGSVVVAGDVIEHLVHPETLVQHLAAVLPEVKAVLISTPARELFRGVRSNGPPQNKCHVREWTLRELQALLTDGGMPFHTIGLMRSNDRTEEPFTTLAGIPGKREDLSTLTATLIDYVVPASRRHPFTTRVGRAARVLLRG